MLIIFGALLVGGLGVALSAYAEHGLRTIITSTQFDMLMSALHYQQLNAVLITVVGLILLQSNKLAGRLLLKPRNGS